MEKNQFIATFMASFLASYAERMHCAGLIVDPPADDAAIWAVLAWEAIQKVGKNEDDPKT